MSRPRFRLSFAMSRGKAALPENRKVLRPLLLETGRHHEPQLAAYGNPREQRMRQPPQSDERLPHADFVCKHHARLISQPPQDSARGILLPFGVLLPNAPFDI